MSWNRIEDGIYASIRRIADLYCYAVYGFLILPLIAILPLSFSSDTYLSYPMHGFSLRWYEELFLKPQWLSALQNSLVVGLLSMLAATVLGVLAAFGMVRQGPRVAGFFGLVFLLPMIVPVIIYAVSAYVQFSGWGLVGNYAGLVVTHTALAAPLVVVTMSATLRNFDWRLVRAAYSHGATPLQTFRYVVLPNIVPGLVSGALFAFIISFDEVVVTLFLATPSQTTLPLQLFSSIRDEVTPVVTSASAFMIVVSMGIMLVIEVIRRRKEGETGNR